MNRPAVEPIAAAIAAAEAKAGQVVERRIGGGIQLTSGRVVHIDLPADLTDHELLDLMSWCSTQLRVELAGQRAPRPRILVPRA